MVALEVLVNGKRRYVAGHLDARVLSIGLTGYLGAPAPAPTYFGLHSVVGVPSGIDGQLTTLSYPTDRLSVGDEITIRIVEVDGADPPSTQKAPNTLGSWSR